MIKYLLYSILLLFGLFILILLRYVYQTIKIYLIYKRKYGNDVKVLFYPVLGIAYFLQNSFEKHDDSYEWMKTIVRENPNLKAILILSGLFNYIILQDEHWVKNFSQDQNLYYKNDGNFAYSVAFGRGLFFSKFGDWKRQRMFLNSTFHFDSLKAQVPIVKQEAKKFLCDLSPEKGFVKLNIFEELQKVTSEIITISYFGQSLQNVKCQNGKFIYQEVNSIVQDSYIYRITSPYFILKAIIFGAEKGALILNSSTEKALIGRFLDVYETYGKFIDEDIQKKQKSGIDPREIQPKNMIDIYIKEYLIQQSYKQNLKKEDIIERKEIIHQFLTFYFAGSETTSHLVTMTLYELSKNQKVYDKLIQEINQIAKDVDTIEHNDLSKFQYLDLVLKESTRLYNAVAFTFPRVANQDYQKEDLYLNKELLVCHRLTQYSQNCEILKDSDEFIPERFNRSTKGFSSFDVIPFSTGPRNCIGQHFALIQAKYLIIQILKNFDLKPIPEYKLRLIQKHTNHPIDKEMFLIKRKAFSS